MAGITRLSGSSDWIDLDFVERERTGLVSHFRMPSLFLMSWVSNNRKAVHDWVQKAELQPDGDVIPTQN
jgi:hypothetical protein